MSDDGLRPQGKTENYSSPVLGSCGWQDEGGIMSSSESDDDDGDDDDGQKGIWKGRKEENVPITLQGCTNLV